MELKVNDPKLIEAIFNGDAPDIYFAPDVDTLISEKDALIAELKSEIRRKEAVEQRWFEQCMEARSEAIRLKRALWLARANRALEKIAWFKLWNSSISTMNPEDGARQEFDKWVNVERKCRAKAEEYK